MAAALPEPFPLVVCLFGSWEVQVRGAPLPRLRTQKDEWLLALLVLRAGAPIERGWLAGTLWPESSQSHSLANLRKSLTHLRRALGGGASRLGSPTPRTLALDLSNASVDALAFDAAVARGDMPSLEQAVALYRGPLLEGCTEAWAFQERQVREQAYLGARERLAALCFERGETEEAERHLRQAVAVDPLREGTQRALMQVLAAGGNYAAALHCYRELRLHLHRELNTEPDAETQTLLQRLRGEARRLSSKGGTRGWGEGGPERIERAPSPRFPLSPSPRPSPAGTVTFLLTDIEGSTRLWEEQPEAMRTVLPRHDALLTGAIEQHGGVVVKRQGEGDSLFAVFARPTDAASAACALQQAVLAEAWSTATPLRVRVALYTGEAEQRDGDYFGPAVNRCARLRAVAHGGQVLLPAATGELVRDHLPEGMSLRDLGEHRLKDLVRAVRVFQLLHPALPADFPPLRPPGSRPTDLPAPEREAPLPGLPFALTPRPLVGREKELAALERRLEAAEAGRGAACLLAGEPGIGKTRLATEACALARQRGFRVLAGRCDEHGASPYQPFIEALRAYLDRASPAQAEAVLPPPVASELVRLVPRLTEKVREVPSISPAAGAAARPALVEAMGEFFAMLTAGEGPVLLFLDDLHWADEGSLSMLHHLARRAKGLRLLIVGTYRDLPPDMQRPLEQTLAALNRERLAERLPLGRLPEAAVGPMVDALLEESLPLPPPLKGKGESSPPRLAGEFGPFVRALYQQTEGNPFFLEEVLQHLVEEGAIYRQEGRWQIQVPAEFRVPPSVQAAIGQRLERLSAESREALTLASVIGARFGFELLLQASEEEEERLLGWVEEWLGARLVMEEREGREEVYQFQHALIREVLYGGVSRRRRARCHLRVAEALEALYPDSLDEYCALPAHRFGSPPGATMRARRNADEYYEPLAHHYECGGNREKAIDYRLKAGEKAHYLNAGAEAIQHLQGALRLLDTLPEDEAHLKRRCQVAASLSRAHEALLDGGKGRQVLEEYLARAERAGYAWGMAAAHNLLAWSGVGIEGARRHCEASVALCEQHGLADLLPQARWRLADLLTLEPGSDCARAEALLRQNLESGAELSPAQVQVTYSLLTGVYGYWGKWEAVMAALRESIAAGAAAEMVFALNRMEAALEAQGRRAEFVAFCEEARRLLAQAGALDPLAQWYLAPAEPSPHFTRVSFQDDFEAPALRGEWQWENPFQVSAYSLTERPGFLTLRAAAGTTLWHGSNFSAPRLLLEVRGDFALEARVEGDWDAREEDGMSGLLVWKDILNFVRLDKTSMSRFFRGRIALEARIQGEYRLVGRGLLRGEAFHLRLEREGERLTALCSAEGVHWLTCGQFAFPAPDPLRVGIVSHTGMVAHFDWVRVLTKP